MNNSLIVDGINIPLLSDEELLERLQNFGFNPGPILDSTREVYQRKLARLMRNEEFEDSEDIDLHPFEGNYPESPVLSSSFESYSASPSLSIDELRRRPLSRVEGEKLSDDSTLSSHKTWSPADIVTQVTPPPEEEKSSFSSSTILIIAVIGVLFFVYMIYSNMESAPQNPFS